LGRISRFSAHVPVPGRPCAYARSAVRSAPDATFFASSWAAMEERPPRLPARRRQLPELELSSRVLPSPHLLWVTGPVTTMRLQTQDKEYLWVSFSGTHGAPAGQGFYPRPRHPSTLLLSSQQGLRALCQDLPHRLGRRRPLSWCGHQHCTPSFSKTLLNFVERDKIGCANDEPPGKGNNHGKAPIKAPHNKTMENRSPAV
jgi:hypothetical protein